MEGDTILSMEVVTRSKRMMNLGVYSGLIQRRLISERQAFEGLVPELGRYTNRGWDTV